MTGDRLQMTDDRLTVAPSSEKPVKYIHRLWWRHLSAKKKKKKKASPRVCGKPVLCGKTGFEWSQNSLTITTQSTLHFTLKIEKNHNN